jgi:hypothetical protein
MITAAAEFQIAEVSDAVFASKRPVAAIVTILH